MRATVFAALAVWCSAVVAFADARLSVLVDVIRLPEAAQILAEEGRTQAEDLNQDMLGGQGGAGWASQVDSIYAPQRMVEMLRDALGQELQGELREEVITFYASDLGSRIVTLENTARVAIQDEDVETAARDRYNEMVEGKDARLALIDRYVAGGDMIDRNVTSAMNSNFQFFRGLADGGAIEMSEQDMLADAVGDPDEITLDTTEWLMGYLLLAYSPLSDDELEDYVTFSETPAGIAFNRALFVGFEKAYEDISYALGRAVALNMTAQEL